jgi:hypothetical protein
VYVNLLLALWGSGLQIEVTNHNKKWYNAKLEKSNSKWFRR